MDIDTIKIQKLGYSSGYSVYWADVDGNEYGYCVHRPASVKNGKKSNIKTLKSILEKLIAEHLQIDK